MELIFNDTSKVNEFCNKFKSAVKLTDKTVHFEHDDYKNLPKPEGIAHPKVIDIVGPYGVVATKLGSSIDAAKWAKINKINKVEKLNPSFATFDKITKGVIECEGSGALPMLKAVGDSIEIKFKDIPEQLVANMQAMILESCRDIEDIDERNLFKKKFDLKKVFEDNDAALSIGKNKKGEKVYWLFVDSDRYRYANDYFINSSGSLYTIE